MIFADSSGFIAAFESGDAYHLRVGATWNALADEKTRIVTTSLVFSETVTHLRRHAGWETSRKVGEAILSSAAIEIVHIDADLLDSAWRELTRSGDPKLSFCDAASFVVMRERGIRRALTLDRHFRDAGFETLP